MRELSPYANLHAPHSVGYFSTTEIRFELVAGEGGGTRLIEHTSHALKLAPVLYWLPLARVIVGQNNAHVLAWIKRRAEDNPLAGTEIFHPTSARRRLSGELSEALHRAGVIQMAERDQLAIGRISEGQSRRGVWRHSNLSSPTLGGALSISRYGSVS